MGVNQRGEWDVLPIDRSNDGRRPIARPPLPRVTPQGGADRAVDAYGVSSQYVQAALDHKALLTDAPLMRN
jgi:hypothetical protein